MSYHTEDGWPVDLKREFAKVASWDRRKVFGEIQRADGVFRFFQCPCRRPGRRPHRIEQCDFVRMRESDDDMAAKRLRAATAPIRL